MIKIIAYLYYYLIKEKVLTFFSYLLIIAAILTIPLINLKENILMFYIWIAMFENIQANYFAWKTGILFKAHKEAQEIISNSTKNNNEKL